jgi:hypothetical protein
MSKLLTAKRFSSMDNRNPELTPEEDPQLMRKSISKAYNTFTETDSENEGPASLSIAEQKELLEKHKKKGADAGKKNNKIKRILVGLFVGSTGWMSALLGTPYTMLTIFYVVTKCYSELLSIGRDE